MSSTAITVKIRPRVRLSGSSASSSAAIGDTRVARRAGTRAAASVTSRPTTRASITVRVAITVPVLGRSAPMLFSRALSRPARPIPGHHAQHRSHQADDRGLEHHAAQDLRAGGAERAQHSQLADALGHGDREGVEDQEAAHQQGHSAEHEQDHPQEAEVVLDVLRLALGRLVAGLDRETGGQHLVDAPRQLARLHPVRRLHRYRVELAFLAGQALCLGQGEDGGPGAARGRVAQSLNAGDRVLLDAGLAGDAQRVAGLESLTVGGRLVDRGLVGGLAAAVPRCRSASRTAREPPS